MGEDVHVDTSVYGCEDFLVGGDWRGRIGVAGGLFDESTQLF